MIPSAFAIVNDINMKAIWKKAVIICQNILKYNKGKASGAMSFKKQSRENAWVLTGSPVTSEKSVKKEKSKSILKEERAATICM